MLDYALEKKRKPPVVVKSKREQTQDIKKRVEMRKNSQAGPGKGKVKRNKKNLKQIDILDKVYRVK